MSVTNCDSRSSSKRIGRSDLIRCAVRLCRQGHNTLKHFRITVSRPEVQCRDRGAEFLASEADIGLLLAAQSVASPEHMGRLCVEIFKSRVILAHRPIRVRLQVGMLMTAYRRGPVVFVDRKSTRLNS